MNQRELSLICYSVSLQINIMLREIVKIRFDDSQHQAYEQEIEEIERIAGIDEVNIE